jgi:hypothetical protein
MSREEFLLNVLNVLTPVVNSGTLTDKNGDFVISEATSAAENLYVETLAALGEEIYPEEEDGEVIWESKFDTTAPHNAAYIKGNEVVDDTWSTTLRKSINLLQNQLEDYLNNK